MKILAFQMLMLGQATAVAVSEEARLWHWVQDTPFGSYLSTTGYFVVSLLCIRAMLRVGETAPKQSRTHFMLFWGILAGLMLALAVDERLGLQQWLTQLGRQLALADHWYQRRRVAQTALVMGGIAFGLTFSGVLCWLARDAIPRYSLAILGATFTLYLLLFRASSLHEVDQFLFRGPAGRLMNPALELAGILCVGASAWGAVRWPKPTPEHRAVRGSANRLPG
jgi:hypothetical protein